MGSGSQKSGSYARWHYLATPCPVAQLWPKDEPSAPTRLVPRPQGQWHPDSTASSHALAIPCPHPWWMWGVLSFHMGRATACGRLGSSCHPPPCKFTTIPPEPTNWQVALRLVGFERQGSSVLHVIQAGWLATTLLFISEAKKTKGRETCH